MYDPTLERFVQRDPITYRSGDDNLYRYCGDDPVDRADPVGTRFIITIAISQTDCPNTLDMRKTQECLQGLLDKSGVDAAIILTCGQQNKPDLGVQYATHCYGSQYGWNWLNPAGWVYWIAHDPLNWYFRNPIGYNHNVSFNKGLRPAVNMACAQTGANETVIWPDHIVHQLQQNPTKRHDLPTVETWTNVLAHEVLHLGLLGRRDSCVFWWTEPDQGKRGLSSAHQDAHITITLSPAEAAALKKACGK